MTVTQNDLQEFHHFAGERLANGGAESLADLVRQWEAQRESRETVADILEGDADIEAGRVKPLDEAFFATCKTLGWSE